MIRLRIEIMPRLPDDPPEIKTAFYTLDLRSPRSTYELGIVIGSAVSCLSNIPGSREEFLDGILNGITK